MEVAAKLSGARISAQKARLVADQIRGKKVGEALNLLAFSSKKAAEIMKKVLESAVANAEHNEGADIDELKVKTIYVEQGTTLKRSAARAKGRAIAAHRSQMTRLIPDDPDGFVMDPATQAHFRDGDELFLLPGPP